MTTMASIASALGWWRPNLARPVSQLCTASQFREPHYLSWCTELGLDATVLHRKNWEFAYICRTADALGCLRPHVKALGFGVGTEPIPSALAARGLRVTATDAPSDAWTAGNQYATDLKALWKPHALPWEAFADRVSLLRVDMNAIPSDLRGYDLLWSSCALEHLGGLQHGIDFILNAMDCLKPGGVAIHTTEFNVSSDRETYDSPALCLYRRQDLKRLSLELRRRGHEVMPLVFNGGKDMPDRHIDIPPYGLPHLKLAISIDLKRYVITSVGIAIRKGR